MKIKAPKKLIEVALPLDDINAASSREKSIRHGHPSTLHLWWARRPLAAARAVLFAQLVNDPGYDRSLQFGVNKEKAQAERERLFKIIRKLVLWENTNNEEVLAEAQAEIRRSWCEVCELNKNHPRAAELFNPDKLPAFHDPFAGGGAIPLEAQRLGLEAYASDLNPVAVLINKAMIEIPPRFAGRKPVGPIPPGEKQQDEMYEDWLGAKGLAEDVRRYGHWMLQEAQKRIGHLYPSIEITAELAQERKDLKPLIGQKLTVIAWLWARTVKSPNPAFSHVDVPLASTFMLSTKPGKEAYVEPVVEDDKYRFVVKTGKPRNTEQMKNGTKAGTRAQFRCLLSNTPIDGGYIKSEGQAGRIGSRLMGIVAEGVKGRIYFSPTKEHELIARQANPEWRPEIEFAKNSRHMTPWVYGLSKFGDLFTSRQLVALTTFSDLAQEARELVYHDALVSGMPNGDALDAGGSGAQAYADAVSVYLGFAIDRLAMTGNSLVRWNGVGEKAQHCFGRQALPMIWDYAEPNFLAEATGSLSAAVFYSYDPIPYLPAYPAGSAGQADAQSQVLSGLKIVSTDPPYYDNVPYADLSDFFYVWLRRSLRQIFPNLFATLAVPKAEELVADAYRQGNKEVAEEFFLGGMTAAIHRLVEQAHPASPITIYYAFKQSETQSNSTASTGWETFLEGLIGSSLAITGTWPLRTEMATRMRGMDSNALASSILLVCRQRAKNEQTILRREFQRELKEALPEALDVMIGGKNGISPVAPVDLAQAAIGPGMAVFSQYTAVLEADGSPMSVRTALTLINKAIDEYFSEAEGELDVDSRFCVQWFEENGWYAGQFGQADVLARAKGTSVDAVRDAGVIESGGGKVRLLRFAEYPIDWNPENDNRTPVWEALHHMIRVLQSKDEATAGTLLARMPARADAMRQLAYRLYTMCERKGWAEDARAYNELITSWRPIEAASHDVGHVYTQQELLG